MTDWGNGFACGLVAGVFVFVFFAVAYLAGATVDRRPPQVPGGDL